MLIGINYILIDAMNRRTVCNEESGDMQASSDKQEDFNSPVEEMLNQHTLQMIRIQTGMHDFP